MIIDGLPFRVDGDTFKDRAINSFVDFFQRKLGVKVIRDVRTIPFEQQNLDVPLELARLLESSGIITTLSQAEPFADEPPIKLWSALCNTPSKKSVGGASLYSDADAMTAALAEGLERYLWWQERDYLRGLVRATASSMKRFSHINPLQIAGFSAEQRVKNPKRTITDDSTFLWARALSLVSNTDVYIPVQLITGNDGLVHGEPQIRDMNTIGLATWPTKIGARLSGALECIEREAYMVTWLNQFTLPRISIKNLCELYPSLGKIIETCLRYRLRPHFVRLITDAPATAILAVLEDESGMEPRFSFGLCAHRSLERAAEKSLSEAMRARRLYRYRMSKDANWDPTTAVKNIGHFERTFYWAEQMNATRLEFLIAAPEEEPTADVWASDTPDQHLDRIISWCRDLKLECLTVSLGDSKKNPTPWYIEKVIMPQLQPAYLFEHSQLLGSTRWREVPAKLSLNPRTQPYIDAPHPFA